MSQTALVTGASSGIGAAIATELAHAGFDLVLAARRVDRMQQLADRVTASGVKVSVVQADLAKPEGVRRMIAAVDALGAEVDVLVNNAGFGQHGYFWEVGVERSLEMIELNVTTLTLLTHHYLKPMVARGRGRILQISSIGAFQPTPYYAVYSATKAYVLSFSEALHYELRGTGVSVTSCCPGLTATEFHAVAEHNKPGWMAPATMSAEAVAARAVRAALGGKRVVVPGVLNWLMMLLTKLAPKRLAIASAAATMKK